MQNNDNVVIVGGGPVGTTLALLLAQGGLATQVYEARELAAAYQDKRALALSYGSRLIFEKLGVWQALAPAATAIKTIHVSQQGGFGRAKLQAQDHGLDALGYVVSYGALSQVLDSACAAQPLIDQRHNATVQTITFEAGQALLRVDHTQPAPTEQLIRTPLAVIADGGRSLNHLAALSRNIKAYGHDALVTKVRAAQPHQHVAYERFTPAGPVALLPNGEHDFSLVWTGQQEKIAALLQLSDDAFLAAFHTHFGDRVGQFLAVEKRRSFPLVKAQISAEITPHLVVIGNAAQTMHPVAGQGFNVGLRDAATLAKQLMDSPAAQWGSFDMLQTYAKHRARDTQGGLLFTDFLVNVFSNDWLGLSSARGAGLGLLELLNPAKRLLVNKMSYGK